MTFAQFCHFCGCLPGGKCSAAHDWIHIRDLSLRCVLGVHDFERHEPRDVVIQLSLGVSLQKSGRSDSLCDTVDYSALRDGVATFVEASQFQLIESLAEGIADLCLQVESVSDVLVMVEKPGAIRDARTVAVEIFRSRS